MTLSYDFLINRADEAADVAASATLDNVRDIALRSEAAWRDMATRALRAATARETAAMTSAAERA